MKSKFANRVNNIKPSPIRELLKLTQKPGVISFAGGLPAPEMFPIEGMKVASLKVLEREGREALQYSTTEGHPPLRQFIADRMRSMGIETDPANILITNGSQQGLEFTSKIFIDDGDVILCESPSYVGAINAFNAYLPKFVEIPMDDNGIIMEDLEKALNDYPNAKFIYTIPDFQNPTGRTMAIDRRKKIVELAKKYDVLILEDSPYGELIFEGEKMPPVKSFDKDGNVIFLGTFSKTFCPGLRVGWVEAQPDIIRKYILVKQGADLQTNSMSQREISAFLEVNDFDEHIQKIIDVYRSRRDVMLGTMAEEFPPEIKYSFPHGGLFTWVILPNGIDAADVLKKALELDVAFVPGSSFFPNGGNENHFRLNYGTMDEKNIIEGITRLGKVLKEL